MMGDPKPETEDVYNQNGFAACTEDSKDGLQLLYQP